MNRMLAAVLVLYAAAAAAAAPPPRASKETGVEPSAVSPAPKRKPLKVLVVPIRYLPPAGNPVALDAYNGTLPKVGQAQQTAMMKEVAQWWGAQTYGMVRLDVTVVPLSEPGKLAPGCDWGQMLADGRAGAKAAGFEPADFSRLMVVTTYSCWQSHWVTAGSYMFSWNTYPDAAGKAAHELGHALGLEHSAGLDGSVYSNNNSQMGVIYPTLTRLNAFEKDKLGAVTPRPCADATLGSLDEVPDAIRCGDVWIEYRGDTRELLLHRAARVPSSFGDADNELVARLNAGQSWTDGTTLTVRHDGNGRAVVRAR